MRGACLTENVLYYAKISCDDKKYKLKLYKGICETTFKGTVMQINTNNKH